MTSFYERARAAFGVSASEAAYLFRGLREAPVFDQTSTAWICERVMESMMAYKEDRLEDLVKEWRAAGYYGENENGTQVKPLDEVIEEIERAFNEDRQECCRTGAACKLHSKVANVLAQVQKEREETAA